MLNRHQMGGSIGANYDMRCCDPPAVGTAGSYDYAVHWTDSTLLPPHQQYLQYNPTPMTKEDTMPVRLTQQQIDTLHDLATQTGDRSALTVEHSREHRNIVVAQVHGRTLLLDYEGSYIDAV